MNDLKHANLNLMHFLRNTSHTTRFFGIAVIDNNNNKNKQTKEYAECDRHTPRSPPGDNANSEKSSNEFCVFVDDVHLSRN